MSVFTNQAQLSYNDQTTSSNVAVGELVSVLTATKTSLNTDYTHDDSITYVINLVNSGASPILGINITDDLGAIVDQGVTTYPLQYRDKTLVYYIESMPQPTPTIASKEPLNITGLNLPGNSHATLIYEALVTDEAPLETGSSITNTAEISANDITTFTTSLKLPVSTEPELTITKTMEPVPVTRNGILTYTFLIQNYGNTEADATDRVSLTDTFDPLLSGINVTLDGKAFSAYTYNEQTGLFTTTPGSITVPAASYMTDQTSGVCSIAPGYTTLVVSGTV
ncbi:MAG: hypothetical protein Q4B57_04245 [Eubacteriales bacterium]|nr:hypothetical protein [Eubacteriales bacterium]